MMKRHPAKKVTSEKIRCIENDHHVASTSCAWFHPDHLDLRIGVVQVMTNKPPEIVFPWLDGGRDAVKDGIGDLSSAWCNMLRDLMIAKMTMILISLQRSAQSVIIHVDRIPKTVLTGALD
jgi:hypothetical protein